MNSRFDDYLDQTEKPLESLTEREIAAWRAEAASHLETLYEVERAQGHSDEEAQQRALVRFGTPQLLGQAMEQEARLVWTKRVRQEVARRIFGALVVPLVFSWFLANINFGANGLPILNSLWRFTTLGDWPLTLMFFIALAGAGYQAMARRRLARAALAGGLGAALGAGMLLFLSTPVGSLFLSGLNSLERYVPRWDSVGTFYGFHFITFLPYTGFLFATWCAALGTKPKRATVGSGLFTLATYTLFQLRDCFLSPELWSKWGPMLMMACIYFVLPAMFLGGLYAALGQLAERLVQWLWARLRRVAPQYRQRL